MTPFKSLIQTELDRLRALTPTERPHQGALRRGSVRRYFQGSHPRSFLASLVTYSKVIATFLI